MAPKANTASSQELTIPLNATCLANYKIKLVSMPSILKEVENYMYGEKLSIL